MNHKRSVAVAMDRLSHEVLSGNVRAQAGLDELFAFDMPQPERKVKHYKQVIPVSIHHFYVIEEIKGVDYYLNMINTIRTAEQHDTIFMYLNTPGGSLHTAVQIISAIRQSAATVVTCLEGEVCSAGTMLFLAGHKHVVSPNCTFMIHNYSQGAYGKGNDLTNQVNFTASNFAELAQDIYGGFLTDEEIQLVLGGKDYWMGSKEVARRVGDKLIVQDTGHNDEVAELIKSLVPADSASDPAAAPPGKEVKPKKVAKSKK